MSRRSGVIPSTFRLWTSRILLQRRSAVFSLFGVTVVTLFLLVSPPDFDIRGSIFPRPWGPHIPFEETSGPPGGPVSPPDVWAERAQAVRRAFIHGYGRYESIAFPFDELLPMSNGSMNKQVLYSRSRVQRCGTFAAMDPLNLSPCYKLTHFFK